MTGRGPASGSGGAYRQPSREAARRIRYGPFAPPPRALAVVVALSVLALVAFASGELSSEVECRRAASGDAPTCVRRSRSLRSPGTERSTPAWLERAGSSGNAPPLGPFVDVLRFDGVTLVLPNSPPGPFSRFLQAPDELRVRGPRELGTGAAALTFLFVLLAFFSPRLLLGVTPSTLVVDRHAGALTIRRWWARTREVPVDDIASVRVERTADHLHPVLRAARVSVVRKGGLVVPLAPFARAPRASHERVARALAVALGVGDPVSLSAQALPLSTSPWRRGVLAAQLICGGLAIAIATWLQSC